MDKLLKDLFELIDSKQGINPILIDIRDISSISDYIMIVTANSLVHSGSLAKYVQDFLDIHDSNNSCKKNIDLNNPWVLIDGGDIIINIFLKETREFYNLEKLYFNGKVVFDASITKGSAV
jgi:ribosome-associated protein